MDYAVVFGSPRSGTTFLQGALKRLKNVEARIGNHLPIVVPHLVNQDLSTDQYRALCESFRLEIDVYLSNIYNSRFKALEDWWAAPDQWERLGHVVRKGRRPLPETFIYKEPFLSLAPEYVFDALPEAKIIYIYRDGRDVANSLVSSYDVLTDEDLTHLRSSEMRMGRAYDHRYVPWWVDEGDDEAFIQSGPYGRAIWMWAYMVERCRAYFETLDDATATRVLQIRYEHFMNAPHEVGDAILAHLDMEDTRAFRRQLDTARNTSIGKHRRRPDAQIEAAEVIAGSALQKLGYR